MSLHKVIIHIRLKQMKIWTFKFYIEFEQRGRHISYFESQKCSYSTIFVHSIILYLVEKVGTLRVSDYTDCDPIVLFRRIVLKS